MSTQHDRNWNFDSDDDLLYAYTGNKYKNTSEDLEKLAQSKAQYEVPHVARMLDLKSRDVVVDLGSGYGHIAKELAPNVTYYHCCDISSRMLDKCMSNTAGVPNISYHTISRSDLRAVSEVGVNKIFANSVFIHLNMFDITRYLDQMAKMLPPGGLIYFNIQDSDVLATQHDPTFMSMRARYLNDPQEITLMIWNSLHAIRGYGHRLGLRMKRSQIWQYCATSVTFEKPI